MINTIGNLNFYVKIKNFIFIMHVKLWVIIVCEFMLDLRTNSQNFLLNSDLIRDQKGKN